MKLEYRSIKDPGNFAKERVVLRAMDAGDVGKHIVFRAMEESAEALDSTIEVPFWIPDKEVKENDLVVIYTKSGADTQSDNKNGTVSHFFYMGRDEAIWGSDRAFVIVVEGARWQMKRVRNERGEESDELAASS